MNGRSGKWGRNKRIRTLTRRGLAALVFCLGVFGLSGVIEPAAEPAQGTAILLQVEGAIGPATAAYVQSGIEKAHQAGAKVIVLKMDTPGGLDTAMRDIIRAILSSPIPVITYVTPSGARAASAGTYILYASHVAAMAPGTNLGAATPVAIGGGGGLPFPGGRDQPPREQPPREQPMGEQPSGDQSNPSTSDESAAEGAGGAEKAPGTEPATSPAAPKDASAAKAINDAVAYIRALADMHGRNADWAEKAVREAASLSARDALDKGVIDIVAPSLPALLDAVDGREVTVNGAPVTLATAGLTLQEIEPDWHAKFLAAITNPNVALILMMIGVYGLIFEFMNPGAIYPGTIGAISLIIGLYALGTLPVNYAGVALILLGIALMVGEAFAPSFGILGIGGTIAFVLGTLIMFESDAPGFEISWAIIATLVGASLLFTLILVPMIIAAQRRKVATGAEEMIDSVGVIQDWTGKTGHVFVHGERWKARGGNALSPDQQVRVTGIDGLTLTIEPLSPPHDKETRDV